MIFNDPLDIFTFCCLLLMYSVGGPHMFLFPLYRWINHKNCRTNKKEMFKRVGIPCAGVVTHRQYRSDGLIRFRYAYRPPNNPNKVYIRNYVQEPKHLSYPWSDDRILVILIAPGHNASGMEVRKLTEPFRFSGVFNKKAMCCSFFASYVTLLLFAVSFDDFAIVGLPCLAAYSICLLICLIFLLPTDSDGLYDKFDLNASDPSLMELEEATPGDDGETSPIDVQNLSRQEIIPALEHAETKIEGHLRTISSQLQTLPDDDSGNFLRDLLQFYARRDAEESSARSTSSPADVAVGGAGSAASNVASRPDIEEQVPLVAATTPSS